MDPIRLATELAEALRESEEYQGYLKAEAKVNEHEAAKIMLEDLRRKQLDVERKRLAGEEISQKDKEEFGKLSEIIGYNPYIREYLMAEMRLQQLMMEIQKIIASGVGLKIPDPEESAEQGEGANQEGDQNRKGEEDQDRKEGGDRGEESEEGRE